MGKTAVLSDFLREKQVELSGVRSKVSGISDALNGVKEDSDLLWGQAKTIAEERDLEMPRLARKRKAPDRLESGGSEPYYSPTPKDQFRIICYEIVDTVQMDLRERFNENEYKVLTAVETLLADALTESRPEFSLLQTFMEAILTFSDFSTSLQFSLLR